VCRYGTEAGTFTEHVVHTAVGAAGAAYNISNLGVSVMARRAAADSVIAMGSSAETEALSSITPDSPEANPPPDRVVPPAYSVGPPVDDVSLVLDALASAPSTK